MIGVKNDLIRSGNIRDGQRIEAASLLARRGHRDNRVWRLE
jgi:hypothetical protein